jgi:hypothetical protein
MDNFSVLMAVWLSAFAGSLTSAFVIKGQLERFWVMRAAAGALIFTILGLYLMELLS